MDSVLPVEGRQHVCYTENKDTHSREKGTSMTPWIKQDLCLQDYIEMERMEIACYGAEHTTPAAEAMRWAEKIPSGILVAADERGIAGFINLFPVDDRVLQRLRAGQCNDRDLSADELSVLLPDGATAHLFLSCIVVREEFYGTGFAYALTDAAMRRYDAISADVLITDNATAAGSRFSERLGMQPVCKTDYGTVVRESGYAAARERVRQLAKRFGSIAEI